MVGLSENSRDPEGIGCLCFCGENRSAYNMTSTSITSKSRFRSRYR
jgi:hypothetical protein